MSDDLTTSSPIEMPENPDPRISKTGQNRAFPGIFSDIDPDYQLSPAQCRAIEFVLDGKRWSQIARMLDLDPKTLWRWKTHNENFQQALAAARSDRRGFAVERCQTFATRATDVLGEALTDPAIPNRLRAAQILLQAAAKFNAQESRRAAQTDDDYWPEPQLPPKVG
jgi:hypothetical protein